ncbi:uncharacterized protein LOC105637740 isoform X2 [Jatropha curcas]|uniref:uncharacterized protein LOC105637740 isoform X2 n=1 Tax=Jatropha curcas TaxID=180498 RepID=UPI0005FB1C41|nr:uncharacterized protein LOC105637740 isoform X2 [Jatropha curcas]
MASSKVVSRLSSRLKLVAFKIRNKSLSPQPFSLNSSCSTSQPSLSTRRLSRCLNAFMTVSCTAIVGEESQKWMLEFLFRFFYDFTT